MSVIKFSKVAMSVSAAALFLSACSSGGSSSGGGVLSSNEVSTRMSAADAQILKVIGDGTADNPGISGTAFERIPTEGTAVYRGVSTVMISDGDNMVLDAVGIANVNVDFGAAEDADVVTGNLRNMRAMDADGNATFVDGELLLSGGEIGKRPDVEGVDNTSRANSLFADYAGSLSAFGETYGLAGELQGTLRGTRTNEDARSVVRAVDLSVADASVAGSVSGLTADITVAADNDFVAP